MSRDAGLKIGQASKTLGIHPNTLRIWERRAGIELCTHEPGRYRIYDPAAVTAMKDAQDQGFTGASIIRRAAQLRRTGRYDEPPALRERMLQLEKKIDLLTIVIRNLHRELTRNA